MLARQAPQGVGGTNGTITAGRRSGDLAHYGLRLGQGNWRHGLGPGLWLYGGRGGTIRSLELDKEGFSRPLVSLNRAQKPQCE